MTRLYLDAETFWSAEYTLKKLTPVEYVMDERFEPLGSAFAIDDEKPFWVDGPELPQFFKTIDWPTTVSISHNALFDMAVLAFRYGITAGLYGCSLSMARNLLGPLIGGVSLADCARHYGLSEKRDTAQKFKGLNLAAIKAQPDLYREMVAYGIDDVEKCRAIFANLIADGFPPGELETIDWCVRMVTEPKFEIDAGVLTEHLAEVQQGKRDLLEAAGLDASNVSSLMSDQQLAAQLLFLGVLPPTKMSKRTRREAFAFAKTDRAFTALLEHPEPAVKALVSARLGHKSTIEESRAERLLAIANVVTRMPVPLGYSAAHTHRLGGTWDINLQNLPRGGELRKAFRAPKGKLVVSVDASQIEARFNASISSEHRLVEAFRKGEDVYASFAQNIYGHAVSKIAHPRERFVGKTGILSLGYGSSAPVFQNMCRLQGDVVLTDSEAQHVVDLYRNQYRAIVANWRRANDVILPLIAGQVNSPGVAWGPMRVERGLLLLPNGNRLQYPSLHQELVEGRWQWVFMRGKQPQRIYGAKLVENVCQALAFVHLVETAMQVKRLTGGELPAHQVHDELIYIVDKNDADWLGQQVVQEMSRSPEWMPHVPLAAEAHAGESYGQVR